MHGKCIIQSVHTSLWIVRVLRLLLDFSRFDTGFWCWRRYRNNRRNSMRLAPRRTFAAPLLRLDLSLGQLNHSLRQLGLAGSLLLALVFAII